MDDLFDTYTRPNSYFICLIASSISLFFGFNTIESKETFWGLFILCFYIKLVNLGKFFQSYNSHFIAVFSTA